MKNKLLGALLLLSMISFGQTVLFNENFGPGSTSTTVSAGVTSTTYYSYPINFQNQYPVVFETSGPASFITDPTKTSMKVYTSSTTSNGWDVPILPSNYTGSSGNGYSTIAVSSSSVASRLTINNIDTSNKTGLKLSFGLRFGSTLNPFLIEQSQDNGSTWTQLTYLQAPPNVWVYVTCNEDLYASNLLKIRFTTNHTSNNGPGTISIDDVKITYTGSLSSIQNQFSSLLLYPNPSSNNFYLSTDTQKLVKIFDISGKMVFNKEVTNEIETSGLTPGVYICEIYEGENKIIKRLIKQ